MKRWIAPLLLGSVVSIVCVSPADAQTEGERVRDVQQVLATMDALSVATVKQDLQALSTIFHDNVSYGHSGGELQTKAEVIEVTRTRRTDAWKFNEPNVTIIGSTALVRAIMVSTRPREGPDSPPADSSSNVLWVLVRGNGPHGWQIVARQNFRP